MEKVEKGDFVLAEHGIYEAGGDRQASLKGTVEEITENGVTRVRCHKTTEIFFSYEQNLTVLFAKHKLEGYKGPKCLNCIYFGCTGVSDDGTYLLGYCQLTPNEVDTSSKWGCGKHSAFKGWLRRIVEHKIESALIEEELDNGEPYTYDE